MTYLHSCRPAAVRRGATLVEVLMSLMIMGLGITSVFTLFPMSVLRSIKATNNTHAALLSENAREFVLANQSSVLAVPQPSTGNKDLLLTITTPIPDAEIPDPFVGTFVVDPYGGNQAASYGSTAGRYGRLLRVANNLTLNNASSGDSWVTDFSELPVAITLVTGTPGYHRLRFSGTGLDFNGVANGQSRVLVTSSTGRRTHTITLDSSSPVFAADEIQLSERLPSGLDTLAQIGTVRLQNYERRYTWMLTVTKAADGNVSAQCAVFFRRAFGDAETVHNVSSVNVTARTINVTPSAGSTDTPKAGSYILGTHQEGPAGVNQWIRWGHWYRVVNVELLSSGDYQLTLDQPWRGATIATLLPRIVIPTGLVGVYDL